MNLVLICASLRILPLMSVDVVGLFEGMRGRLVCIPVGLDSTTIKWSITVGKVVLLALLVAIRPLSFRQLESREVIAISLCGQCRMWLLDLGFSLDNLAGKCWSGLCVLVLIHQDGWWPILDRGWSRVKARKVVKFD